MRVSLIGNVTLDEVLTVDRAKLGNNHVCGPSDFRVGGVMNILPSLDKDLKVSVHSNIGTDKDLCRMVADTAFKYDCTSMQYHGRSTIAHILLEKVSSTRTSFVDWADGIDGKGLIQPKSEWTHIAYLDVMENLDMEGIRKKTKILSADICLTDPTMKQMSKVLKQLRYLDFLFISESELQTYSTLENHWSAMDMANRMGGYVIMHSSNDTTIFHPKGAKTVQAILPEPGLDVLGAGDLYAGFFISALLTKKISVAEASKIAHVHTTNALRRRNDAQI